LCVESGQELGAQEAAVVVVVVEVRAGAAVDELAGDLAVGVVVVVAEVGDGVAGDGVGASLEALALVVLIASLEDLPEGLLAGDAEGVPGVDLGELTAGAGDGDGGKLSCAARVWVSLSPLA
jgi:hypothetical protein